MSKFLPSQPQHTVLKRATVLLLCQFLIGLLTIQAATTYITEDGIKYKVDKKKTYLTVVSAPYSGDIIIPDSVQGLPVLYIGSSAFSECESLTSVTLSDSIKEIGDYAFDTCSELLSVNLPKNLTKIGHWAFRNCYKLTDLDFPEGLTSIGNFCFDKCKAFKKIVLPSTLTNIGGFVFEQCDNVESFTCLSTTPPAVKKGYLNGDEVYTLFEEDTDTNIPLYVPAGCVDTYKMEWGWHHFKNIYELSATAITTPTTKKISKAKGVYNMNGQKIADDCTPDNLAKGVYIIDGKKVIVR